jgi:hypothetical protein
LLHTYSFATRNCSKKTYLVIYLVNNQYYSVLKVVLDA